MGSPPVAVGETIAGKYLVERVIGAGGMGVVVAARHLILEKTVALKFLLPESARDSATVERFTREARALGKIQSDHVAHVMDVERLPDGTSFIVMEYLEGQDLARALRKRGPIPIAEAVGWIREACEAISEAHAAGIVHRDLKPANLFLAQRPNGRSLVKVLDFGISKSLGGAGSGTEPALTKTAGMLGSPLYMAPEQLHRSSDVDRRTDVWACGVILFELLVGTPPFDADSLGALVSAILHETAPPLHTVRPDVPEALSEAVARCLEKDRERRYATIDELAAALAPFAPAPIGSHRPPAPAPSGATPAATSEPPPPVPTAVAPTVLAPTALAPAATVDDPALAASPEPHERTAREAAWAGTKPKLDLPARPSRRASILAAAAAVAAVLAVGAWLASSRARDTAGAGPPSMAPAPSSADVRTAVVPSAESTDLGPPGPSAASSASAPRPRAPRPVAHVASAAAPASASAAPSASAPAAVTSAAPPTNALVQPLPKTPLK